MYWERKGEEQTKYDEMIKCGWEFTKKAEAIFHSYYRYFNDGDFPGWARSDWSLRRMGKFGWELNDKGLQLQEKRITEVIVAEYKRFEKKGGLKK